MKYLRLAITIKDVPTELHQEFAPVAEQSGRSLNKQIIHTLAAAVAPQKIDRQKLHHEIRQRRKKMKVRANGQIP